ncbi:hypothetical protein D621_06780 [beta proteobacterium AAP51]|nr:hypothetical protein D621_06780 [beta proteobacterium AAP51]
MGVGPVPSLPAGPGPGGEAVLPAPGLHPGLDPGSAPGLTLQLAGVPQLRQGPQALGTGTRKALALVVMAVLEPGLRRGRAADLLWPEADPTDARRNLRRDLFRLRQAGLALRDEAGGCLHVDGVALAWPRPAPLLPRWLDGLDDVAGPEFAHWVSAARDALQRRWLAQLLEAARALEHQGDTAAALQAWQALLADGVAGPGCAEAQAAVQRLGGGTLLLPYAAPDAPAPPEPAAPHGAAHAAHAAHAGPYTGPHASPVPLPFLGRETELAAVRAHLAQGRVVLVDGSPGIGKSRLASEALAPRGATLVVRCRPEDSAAPYASALRGLQAAREAAPQAVVPAWARRELGLLVPEWRGRNAPPGPELPEPPLLRRAYRAALQACTSGNFDGLLIDDWQWADDASRELWEWAEAPAAARLPCVIVHRSGELPPAALQRRRRWVDEGLAATVTLRPMDEAQALALLEALAPRLSPGGGPALAAIVARCAGNPLFMIETLRHGAPGQGARPDPADEDPDTTRLPPSVRDILLARARALGPVVRRVLEAASLAGEGLSARLLATALGLDELAVAQALEHAAAAELLLADARGRHRYAHDLYAQAVAESLSPVRRAALHGQLAQALAPLGEEPSRVAWHLAQAGHPAEAAAWQLRAAQVALARGAWPAALAAGQAVLQASTEAAERVQARLLMAQASRRQVDPVAAEAHLDAAWPDAVRAGPALVAELSLARAELHMATSRAPLALEALAALETDPALNEAQQRQLLQLRATALGYLGRHQEALPQLQRLLQQLPPSALAEQLQVTHALARNAYWAGQLDDSRRHVEAALALARRIDDEVSMARCLHRLGALDRERGEVARADEHLREAAELARRAGHIEVLRSALSTRATIYLDTLRLAEAEALISEGEQAAPFWETPDLEDVFDERRFRLHYLRGDVAGARLIAERSLARHGGGSLHSHLGALLQATRLALATGDLPRARQLTDEALGLHAAAGADSLGGRELEALAVELLQAEGQAAQACAAAEAWLAASGARRVEEHARLLAAAAQAALDLQAPAQAAAWLTQARALPVVALEIEAVLLQARLRLAAGHPAQAEPLSAVLAQAEPLSAVLAQARAWLARRELPVLEAARLRQVLQGLGQPA